MRCLQRTRQLHVATPVAEAATPGSHAGRHVTRSERDQGEHRLVQHRPDDGRPVLAVHCKVGGSVRQMHPLHKLGERHARVGDALPQQGCVPTVSTAGTNGQEQGVLGSMKARAHQPTAVGDPKDGVPFHATESQRNGSRSGAWVSNDGRSEGRRNLPDRGARGKPTCAPHRGRQRHRHAVRRGVSTAGSCTVAQWRYDCLRGGRKTCGLVIPRVSRVAYRVLRVDCYVRTPRSCCCRRTRWTTGVLVDSDAFCVVAARGMTQKLVGGGRPPAGMGRNAERPRRVRMNHLAQPRLLRSEEALHDSPDVRALSRNRKGDRRVENRTIVARQPVIRKLILVGQLLLTR